MVAPELQVALKHLNLLDSKVLEHHLSKAFRYVLTVWTVPPKEWHTIFNFSKYMNFLEKNWIAKLMEGEKTYSD